MVALFPGNTFTAGASPGKTGANLPQVAGATFDITVNAVDWAYNLATTAPANNIHLSSTDVNAALPTDASLAAGSVTFANFQFKTAGTRSITATNSTDGTKAAVGSGNIVVSAGAYVKLQVLLPGEVTAPGTATGKTGIATDRTSAVQFTVKVNAVDANWKFVNTISNMINVASTDPVGTNPANKALVAGTTNFSITLRKAGNTTTITATDQVDVTKTYTTAGVPVIAGTFTKLLLLLPGESAAAGTSGGTGKTGTPDAQEAGASISATVLAVDVNWNTVTTVNDVVGITNITTGYTNTNTLPVDAALINGVGLFSVSLNRAGVQRLKATDITNAAKTASTSSYITINVGAFAKLQVILPGETVAPGTATGKTGVPTNRTAGVAFNVTVNAVDAQWNKVTSVTDLVEITSSDAGAILPANAALTAGAKTNFSVTLRMLGSQTITATDMADVAKNDISSSVTVSVGAFSKLQILLPGETAAPGTATGKTGTPSAQVAGVPIVATVNAVDAAWNIVNTVTDVVRITSSDVNAALPPNAALSAGTQTFEVTSKTAGSRTITATDATDGSKTANISGAVTVAPGAYARLHVLLPGETIAPGTATGITGNPNIPARNTQFPIKIYPVDANYNIVSGVTNKVNLVTSDATATVPASANLVNGAVKNLNVTIRTAGVQTITLTDTNTGFGNILSVPDQTIISVSTDFFRSVDSGNWNDAGTWESSTDGASAWHAATLTPTSASSAISILNGHTVTVISNVTVDEVTVQTGGQLTVAIGTLTLNNGTGDDLIVSGKLSNASAITIGASATILFNSIGRYEHNFLTTSGTIPIATWTEGSVCEIIGYTTYTGVIAGSSQAFSDFIWNCPNQNIAGNGPSLGGTFVTRDFTVLATGNGVAYLASTGGTITITRNFGQIGGTTGLNKTSGTELVNIAGNFNLAGGALQKGSGAANIAFNGLGIQTFSKAGSTISGAINVSIISGATVDFGSSVLDGTSGTFTMVAGGAIITAHEDGIAATGTNSGSIQNNNTRTFNVGNFTYNGSNDQLIGTGLPLSIANLTINNAAGVTFPNTTATYSISNALTIAVGFLDMRTNVLTGSFSNTGSGKLLTQAIDAFSTGKIWTVGVEFNSTTNQNIISGTYNRLLATSGAGTKTGPSGALTVAGDWLSSNGEVNLISNNTPIDFSSASAQSIEDSGSNGGNGLLFRNVTFSGSGSKTLTNGDFSISTNGVLTMGASATLNANGNLTLLSSAGGSGSIAAIPSNSSITGSVKVQRFVNGGSQNPYRTYRMLSSPVYDNTTVFINSNTPGNRSYKFSQFIDDMFITGSGGSLNGFDETSNNASSAFTYNDGYVDVTNTSNSVSVGRGAYLFYRGDRTGNKMSSPFDDPESTIIDFEGILNQQSITVPLTYSPTVFGYNLIGNPYASTIDWNSGSLAKSNMSNIIRIWNPAQRQYATYDGTTSVNGGSQYIPSGQSFFVQANNGLGSLTFTEAVKANAQPTVLLLSAPSTGEVLNVIAPVEIRVKLMKDLAFNKDETVVVLKAGKNAAYAQGEDVTYLAGEGVALSSLSSDSKKLAINYMPEIENVSAVKLNVDVASSGNYSLAFNLSNVPAEYTVQLKDKYLNTMTNITDGSGYVLGIDKTQATSFGADRFSVLIVPPVTLPIVLAKALSASKVAEGVAIKWTTSSEVNNKQFEVERRTDDNSTYISIGIVAPKGPSAYTFLDKDPVNGNNYYRLKQIDHDGKEAFFGPVTVKYDLTEVSTATLSIFPNPVNDQFTIKFTGVLESAQQLVKITNSTGQVLATLTLTKAELHNGHNVNISSYTSGVYIVELLDATTKKRVGLLKMIKM